MKEGTKSWLFGCHSIIHSFVVMKAWRELYGRWPRLWQIVCILFHDIGYIGRNYISEQDNDGHAELGARICKRWFGDKAWYFILGHSSSSIRKFSIPVSKLEAPDDYSWIIAPAWWLRWNTIVEPQLHAEVWREAVKRNWATGRKKDGFELAKELWAQKGAA